MTTSKTKVDITSSYELPVSAIDQYRADGFVKLRDVLSRETIAAYREDIIDETLARNKHKDVPMEERTTYGKAFVQVTNLWRVSERAKEFSFSKRLAEIAAKLMDSRGVRMWHDQSLYKEPSGGFTPWHVDQQYWPMASANSVTAWIPLQETPVEMGPLAFARGSQQLDLGRNMPISDDSEQRLAAAVTEHNLVVSFEPYALGEVSFHAGWCLHRAGPNTTDTPRAVHTVIYMDSEMRLKSEADITDTQRTDWEAFSPTTKPGDVMADELNPVLWGA